MGFFARLLKARDDWLKTNTNMYGLCRKYSKKNVTSVNNK